jgi:hypothetical protein
MIMRSVMGGAAGSRQHHVAGADIGAEIVSYSARLAGMGA